MEGRKRSVSILEPDDDVQYYNGDKSLHTLQKLQRFYQERGFDTRGPNEEVLTALVATCRQLIDVNKTQATELSQLREEVKACREETGALSIVTAEQIKDDREQVIRRASRRLSRISRRQSAMTQPAADENEASERRHTSEKDTSFSVSSPPPQAPMGNADREEPFTSEAALPEGLQEEAIIERMIADGNYNPEEDDDDDDTDGEIEEKLRSLLEEEPNKYTLQQKIYTKFKTQIEGLQSSHTSLMSHIDWITPKLTQITEQQVLLLREVEKLQSNVSRLSASEGASQRRHTTAEVMTAEGYRRSLQGRAASMPMAPGHVDPTNELGLLKQYVANLHQKHHQGMVALQEIVDGTQQSVHELYLKQAELEDAVETCRLQRQKTPLPSSAPSEEGSAGVTPAQLERRLREVILDIKWGLLDAVKEVSPREATEDDEEEGDYYANKSHVRERQFLATPPSALATDFSQKFQLLALSTTPLQQTTQKAISTNSEAVDEIIANVDEAIKNILSRLEVLEVYSPHQQSVAARPPLLGLELEDLRDTDGVRIRKVFEGFAGERAGLRSGDVIVGVQEEQVRHRADLYAALVELAREYRCRCQLLMQEAYLKERYTGGERETSTGRERSRSNNTNNNNNLRGYAAVPHSLHTTDEDANLHNLSESLKERAERLRVVLPRFEVSFVVWRGAQLHSVCILIPSKLALESAE